MPWLQTPSSNVSQQPKTLPGSAAMLLSRAPQIVAAHVQNFKVHVDGTEPGKNKDGSGGGNNNNNPGSGKKVQPEVPATIADTESGRTYNRLRILGKGGFAKCFELRDTSTNVLFAGKVIPKTRVAKPAQREKIDREVALHRTLLHRHVVAFHHSFEDEQNIYIILENCNRKCLANIIRHRKTLTEPEVRYYLRQVTEGVRYLHRLGIVHRVATLTRWFISHISQCLANIIRHRKTLTEPEVRYYLRQVTEGVRYLHRLGIVHRDLKLGNFFLTENMDVKIGDFGLATNVEEGVELRRTICGTPNYIAPEVLQKKGHGFAADMWALGCAIYTMLTGKPPFETATLKDTYARILEVQYVMPVRLVTSSKALLRALLCKDPLQRLTLDGVIEHGFLTKEFVPTRLPPTACTVEPRFPTKPVTPKLATLQRCNTLNKKSKIPVSSGKTTSTPAVKAKSDPPSVEKKEKDGARVNRVAATFSNMAVTPSKGKAASTDEPTNTNDNSESRITDDGERSPATSGCDAGGSGKTGSDVKRAIQSAVATFACPNSPRPPESPTTVTAGAAVGSRCDRWATRKMLQALTTCVDNMPTAENPKPPQWSGPRGKVTWVPKWVDYSNRYGFGYQLSDNSVGLLLNDASLITLCPDKRTMQYYPAQSGGRTAIFTAATAPAHLKNALTLLDYFSRYMEDRLIKGGDMPHSSVVSRDFGVERVPYVTRWFRTDRAIVMILSCNTLQINFVDDHVKVILTCGDPEDYVMTYINQQRMSSTYRLVTLAHSGCPAEMRERMTYTRAMLRKVVTMERLL
ncbi:PREDICTED: serine/threonine-protein kinase PLK1-like [Branchiostoma belcheri]|uniref:Serine/threonine-protein kinase PLK n=1 Tax=Branchiostoma belcheri TaxID=7741 RepID=A0A6P5ASD9_BRABE|nr:PREDICTED: serine/threonine-protein kinase PLK1-like [Branchiostoma belcheri]